MTGVVVPWRWLSAHVLRAMHDEQLAVHGGGRGERGSDELEVILARARRRAEDSPTDVSDLAAVLGQGLVSQTPFLDGNARTALLAVELFLSLNGHRLVADDATFVIVMADVAAGELGERELAGWLRQNLVPRER